MEHINKIEIQGIIGSVRICDYGYKSIARMSVATNDIYKNNKGKPLIDTTWHNVIVWSNVFQNLTAFEKGKGVNIIGRIRNVYCLDKTFVEIVASEVKLIEE